MEQARISELLRPYLGGKELGPDQLVEISIYIDLLTKWNAKMNLTAVRDPEEIVRRHFGESLFAARNLVEPQSTITAADVGSGAGFPGIPIKIYAPEVQMTLIEAHGKKATFLREVIRSLKLTNVTVLQDRAEKWKQTAELILLRAVEKFEVVLPVAATLADTGGRLALLIGEPQLPLAKELLPGQWLDPLPIPESSRRVLQIWQNS